MGKYIIVNKDKKGNQSGKYEITYTLIDNNNLRLKLHLYCLGTPYNKYVFMTGERTPFIDSDKDREEFLNEFYKFQKGGSYRKQNPIYENEYEDIDTRLKELETTKQNLKMDLQNQIINSTKLRVEDSLKFLQKESSDLYIKNLLKLITDKKYSFNRRKIGTEEFITIYDNDLDIPFARIKISKYYSEPTVDYLDSEQITNMLI